jgi:hypothetical protein
MSQITRKNMLIFFYVLKRIFTMDDEFDVVTKSKDVTLLEILDRVLDKGVVISGDIVISVADVDLIYLGLKVMLSSVETMEKLRGGPMEEMGGEPI